MAVLVENPALRPGQLSSGHPGQGRRSRATAGGEPVKRPLAGRVVLITGAARGIGAHTARGAAARGARIALLGLEPHRLAALHTELGDRHVWHECDVTDQVSLDRAVAATV